MKILIANATLASRTGTETYVRDLAIGLLRRGHTPIVYAPQLGEIAAELRRLTIPVVDDLRLVSSAPDVIHGNHNTELMSALLHFAGVPAVFFCHSWSDWISAPFLHPRVLSYVAVDETCRDRLLYQHGIPEQRLHVTLHSVDLQRFQPRSELPPRPQRALVFSNNANQWSHLPAVRQACDRAGLSLDVIGAAVNGVHAQPELVLGNYDLVFAKARCALEALVAGAAVILCDAKGSGPLVTTANVDMLRRFNFGIRALSVTTTPEALLSEIQKYDVMDATEVAERIRASSDINRVVDEALMVYTQAIDEFRGATIDPVAEGRAAASYLRWLTLTVRGNLAASDAMVANSLSLRMRNAIGRYPLLDWPLKRIARLARGGTHSNGKAGSVNLR